MKIFILKKKYIYKIYKMSLNADNMSLSSKISVELI